MNEDEKRLWDDIVMQYIRNGNDTICATSRANAVLEARRKTFPTPTIAAAYYPPSGSSSYIPIF